MAADNLVLPWVGVGRWGHGRFGFANGRQGPGIALAPACKVYSQGAAQAKTGW